MHKSTHKADYTVYMCTNFATRRTSQLWHSPLHQAKLHSALWRTVPKTRQT